MLKNSKIKKKKKKLVMYKGTLIRLLADFFSRNLSGQKGLA